MKEIFRDLPSVETERLLLRKMTLDDANDMFRYASDPEMTHFTTWAPHQSIEDSRHFLRAAVEAYEDGDVRNWGIVLKENDRFVGTAGFMWWRTDWACAEIGYAIARDLWGRGLMTEAVRAVIRFGFEQMNLNRIEARCDSLNTGSARVMEKCGMTHEGTLREQFVADGEFRDMKVYSILRREWSPS